jgi:hypothetical protein
MFTVKEETCVSYAFSSYLLTGTAEAEEALMAKLPQASSICIFNAG